MPIADESAPGGVKNVPIAGDQAALERFRRNDRKRRH
jgi:hypothetical protein